MRLAMLAVIMTVFAGCEVRDEADDRAMRADIDVGMTEQQVIAVAGSPTCCWKRC